MVCKLPGMTVFQRARSAEQRAVRRRAILDTAAAMLAEMPVADLTLNELSRRVGLAKSNVLRYFESREAVLLELLASAWEQWLAGLSGELDEAVDQAAPVTARGDQVAAALAASLAVRPVLCDLLSAQAAVLERNVSPELAATYKRSAVAALAGLGALLRGHLGELSQDDAGRWPRPPWSPPARCGRSASLRRPCWPPTTPTRPWPRCGSTSPTRSGNSWRSWSPACSPGPAPDPGHRHSGKTGARATPSGQTGQASHSQPGPHRPALAGALGAPLSRIPVAWPLCTAGVDGCGSSGDSATGLFTAAGTVTLKRCSRRHRACPGCAATASSGA